MFGRGSLWSDPRQLDNCPIKAFRDNVVIELPENFDEKKLVVGTVASIGPNVELRGLSVMMSVIVPEGRRVSYTIGGKAYIVIPFSEIPGAFRHGVVEGK